VKDDKGGEDLDCGTQGNPKVSTLLQVSSESSFGKGADTVYDEKVRKGKEIKAERMRFMFTGKEVSMRKKIMQKLGLAEKSFIDYVRDMIVQNNDEAFLSSDIDVQFYKLALYEPGGHFQAHRDTVHSADHKATLLLEVKSDHKGGMLTLQKNGGKVEWSLSKHDTPERNSADSDDSEDEFALEFSQERQSKNTLTEVEKSEEFQKGNESYSEEEEEEAINSNENVKKQKKQKKQRRK
jgi:hypothetical protein